MTTSAAAAPDRGFAALGLSATLCQVVAELGFTTPTPIQAEAIPLLLAGRDLIGQSATGSGKTAAFGLAILQKLALDERRLQALVLCPTRELCAQVARDLRKLGRRAPSLQVLVVAGGQTARPQLEALELGVHVVVGTPGRVLDLLERRALELASLTTLVVDEADRMLDMGFGPHVETILGAAPRPRQTVFFSATFPRSIAAMTETHQTNPARLVIGEPQSTPDLLRQVAYAVDADESSDDLAEAAPEEGRATSRVGLLLSLLLSAPPESAIVFCNFKKTVARVDEALSAAGISSACLHGDLEQRERDLVLAKFRNRSVRVLVATDVAARGLDIDGLDLVVNFELPYQPEIYVHRIGRTGRAGKAGTAVSLVGRRDGEKVRAIEAAIGARLEKQDARALGAPLVTGEAGATMVTLYISGGRKDKVRPGDILGALTGEAGGLPGSDVGKIEIHDRFSYVAIAKGSAKRALASLGAGRIKGKKFKVGLAGSP